MRHTKGKWMVHVCPSMTSVLTKNSEICEVYCSQENPEETRANARLIAHAPSMLKVLKKVSCLLRRNVEHASKEFRNASNSMVSLIKKIEDK
jgi:hypothetical protein